MINNIRLNEWCKYDVTPVDANFILKKFNEQITYWLISDQLWFDNMSPNEIIDDIFCNFEEYQEEQLPYLMKLVLPRGKKALAIGDIHGVFKNLQTILNNLRGQVDLRTQQVLIDDFMKIHDDYILIFLGDYTDRGVDNLKVLVTIALLALKNPGKVILLRGNHEDISMNKNYYASGKSILSEICNKAVGQDELRREVIYNLIKFYEFLPCGLLLGFTGQNCTNFQLLSHTGLEFRFDYRSLLDYKAAEFSQKGGMCLYQVTETDCLNDVEIEDLLSKYFKRCGFIDGLPEHCKKIISEIEPYLNEGSLVHGFLWNDIVLNDCYSPITKNSRGKKTVKVSFDFVRYFFEEMKMPSGQVVGIVKGHQHHFPKQINMMINNKTSMDFTFPTSSCCLSFGVVKNEQYLFSQNTILTYENIFAVANLMSGSIPNNTGAPHLSYFPAFLEIQNLNNCWMFKAYYNEIT